MSKTLTVIGLMSGTSMDGIDAALVETDGENVVRPGPTIARPCPEDVRSLLRDAVAAAAGLTDRSLRPAPLGEAERAVTAAHSQAVEALLAEAGLGSKDVDIIGFHGQTILHRPECAMTVQLGDGAELARATGIDVVADFRANDMAHGGEGAPFAPIYHQALARSLDDAPVAFLNLGGVANVTWVSPGAPLVAFDTGPANGLIDQWVEAHGSGAMDQGGAMAARGRIDAAVLARLMDHPYFARTPPKSLDRFAFALAALDGLGMEDGAATLTAFTAASVAISRAHLPEAPRLWIACGGGRHNQTMMRELAARLEAPVVSADVAGFRGDSIEAEAFAYLAARSLKRLPLSFPGTTGVARPVTGGVLHRAGR